LKVAITTLLGERVTWLEFPAIAGPALAADRTVPGRMHEQRNALRGARQPPRSRRKRADSLRWNRQERSSVQHRPDRFRSHPAESRISRSPPTPHDLHRAGNGVFPDLV